MDNMRHILIAGLTENKGGLESYIMNIYRNCDRDKVQFDFAVFGDKKIAYTDEIKSLGGRVFHIPRKKQSVKEHYGMMKKIFENTPYEAVYFQFNMKPLSLDLFRYAKKYGVKKRIIHSHNTTEPKMSIKDRIREKLADMKLDKYVNYRFACSYDAGKWMFGNRDYKVIPNCVNCDDFKYDTDRRNAKRRELGLENKYVIGTVGRLQPAKNPEYIIDIINECVKIDKECVLVHIGDGNLKDKINNKVEKLHLEDNVKKTKLEQDIDLVVNNLWEEYELTPNNATDHKKVENVQTTQKEVNDIRAEIKDLGSINVDSIEEYKKTKERYDFMCEQRLDLENTISKLRKMISEITDTMKKQFVEKFKLINKNFNEVFVELFGGGKAELILEDEDNVLECGIDIKAQPTGKKLQNMMLLSGGEKAFTAIALLFAILKINPAPFCILDEIGAALDDVNVYRYAEYLKKFCSDTQFLVITHRKGTMEAADTVYGVTMEENGISKLLSMKLAQSKVAD